MLRSVAVPSPLSSQRHDVPFAAAALSAAAICLSNFAVHFATSAVLPRIAARCAPATQKRFLRCASSFAAMHFASGVGTAPATPVKAGASAMVSVRMAIRV